MSEKLDLVLEYMAGASDHSLATRLAKATKVFISKEHTEEEKIRFIHDVRDAAVFTGGADGFAMVAFEIAIGAGRLYPPPESDAWIGPWLDQWATPLE